MQNLAVADFFTRSKADLLAQNGRAGLHVVHVLLAAFLSLMLAPGPASAAARYVKTVNVSPGHVLWLRSGPGLHFKRVGFLPHGARRVRAYTCKRLATGHWCQVRYRGTRGWALRHYLAKDPARIVREPGRDIPSQLARPAQPPSSNLTGGAFMDSIVSELRPITQKRLNEAADRFRAGSEGKLKNVEWREALAKPTMYVAEQARAADPSITGAAKDGVILTPLLSLIPES